MASGRLFPVTDFLFRHTTALGVHAIYFTFNISWLAEIRDCSNDCVEGQNIIYPSFMAPTHQEFHSDCDNESATNKVNSESKKNS